MTLQSTFYNLERSGESNCALSRHLSMVSVSFCCYLIKTTARNLIGFANTTLSGFLGTICVKGFFFSRTVQSTFYFLLSFSIEGLAKNGCSSYFIKNVEAWTLLLSYTRHLKEINKLEEFDMNNSSYSPKRNANCG